MYSSSDEINLKPRRNAFVQIVKGEGFEISAILTKQFQPCSTIPTDQVPISRDTISCSEEDVVLNMTPSCSLEVCKIKTTHTGCVLCALTARTQTKGGGAGPLVCSLPALSLSHTVITSSIHQESLSPSHTTECGAQQSSLVKSTNHHQGSSSFSSNSLFQAQTHLAARYDITFTQANMEERLNSGALLLQDDNNRINHRNKHSDKWSITPTNIPNKPYLTLSTVQGEEFTPKRFNTNNDYFIRWGIPRECRLRGGGESSLAGSTAGWGNSNNNNANSAAWTASSGSNGQQQQPNSSNSTQPQQPSQWANSNNNNPTPSQRSSTNTTSPQSQQNAGNSVMKVPGNQVSNSNGPQTMQQPSPASTSQNQQPQQQQSGSQSQSQQNGSGTWAQAAGKGLSPSTNTTPSSGSSNTPTTGTSGTTTKQQLEQLNTMREALFSQDGWGGQHVNQDSGWDIPSSPEPGAKDSNGAPIGPVWKPNVNNGTDLWEANLRNGGQPPQQVVQKAPWGHTPASNIGGTWGEDDDLGDASNVWTGVPSGQTGVGGQWGGNNTGPQPPMWGGPKKDADWSGVGGGSNWGDPRDIRNPASGAMDPRSGNDLRSAMVDHRDPMRNVMDHRGMTGNDVMMRGDPRGISGRLNGSASDPMWGGPPQQPPHHHISHQQAQPPNKMVAPNTPGMNQWPGFPPKDMNMPVAKPTGWEEPSPPAQRRNIPNYDDGTSLWGSQQQRAAMQGNNKVSHWKEIPSTTMGRGMQCPPGMPQNRMTPNASNNMKPDTPLWAHPTRNGSWGDGPHDVGGVTPWGEDKVGSGSGLTPWNDPSLGQSWGGPKPKNSMNQTWVDAEVDASNWGHPPKQQVPKPLTRELVWASKQFKILFDMGFKKEEIENTLRATNMVLEDAMEILQNASRGLNVGDAWRGRHTEMEPQFDHTNPQAFPSQKLNPQLQFAPPGGSGSAPNLLNNTGNHSLSNISPAIVQKILSQQPPPQQPIPYNQSRTPQSQPSAQQLRMLVQQIQMAVSAGYLNSQILNQPLAPQTLILLNQLLQQIKHLQQATQQFHQVQNPILGGGNKAQASVQMAKAKQNITNLQNQIAAQQAIYIKQQHHMPPHQGDFFKQNVPDPLSNLPTNFNEMAINKEPQHSSAFQSQQQSRLNQWKLPSLEKDGDMSGGNEFSRAPGTTTKSQGNSSPNLNPLLGQADGTWSSNLTRSNSDTGWPDSNSVDNDSKDWSIATSQSNSQAFTDLVPEFEPGKPWKGTQMKSIEDDPSITPGSVIRSPISLASIKDTEIFNSGAGGKTSPTVSGVELPIPPLSLSSSTWSFTPSSSASFTSPLGKLVGAKSTWGDTPPPNSVSNELWSAPKSRGPPPGLSSKIPSNPGNGTVSGTTNGWGSLGGRWGGGNGGGGPQQNQPWGSTWLILRNLTPQIDGSTLKTLCVQHGPLSNFHLYLNHGLAMAKYSTRDEANKAQLALNNCVLSNTTIFAESLSENEAQNLLQHLGQQSSGGGGWGLRGGTTPGPGSGPKGAPGGDTWGSGSQLWAPSNSGGSSLWGPPPLDNSDQHRATPSSSLNSFLPGDLLGSNDTM